MTTVTGFTAARMLAMEAATIVDGSVVGDDLILEKHDGSTVNAGNVRGPTGSPGVTSMELNQAIPAGIICDYIGTTPPTNWLGMTGQTISGGASLWPNLWAVLPASMKSGSDIVFPNTKGKVSVGYDSADTDFDTIGKTGGSKTHTLTAAQIPSHVHNVDPPNTTVTISDPGHNHSQNAHVHGVSDGGHNHSQNAHNHNQDPHLHGATDPAFGVGGSPEFAAQSGGGGSGFQSVAGGKYIGGVNTTAETTAYNQATTATNNAATTGISVNAATGTNNGATTGITASVNIAAFDSSSIGSGQAHNNVQPYVVFMKIIKAV